MPEGPFGFPRLTSIGPFVKDKKELEWEDNIEERESNMRELGF